MTPDYYSIAQVADILGVSKETLRKWDEKGDLRPQRHPKNNYRVYHRDQLQRFEQVQMLFESRWDEELCSKPTRPYQLIELFAGAGGLAIGMEKAGFQSLLLNEVDKHACATLRKNRPQWNVSEGDIANINFQPFRDQVDILSGGFPCQAFSYAGNKLGFDDTRGTLFLSLLAPLKKLIQKSFLPRMCAGF